jgi:hypothetical protein
MDEAEPPERARFDLEEPHLNRSANTRKVVSALLKTSEAGQRSAH